jgi:hypothetical protein
LGCMLSLGAAPFIDHGLYGGVPIEEGPIQMPSGQTQAC